MITMRKKTGLVQFVALVLVFVVSFFTGKLIADWGNTGNPNNNSTVAVADELLVNRLNVLLLGIDARPGEKDARTDSMILVSIDRDTKKIALVSIPRDTLVEIPGYGKNKINTANALGGAELARETVETLLGIEIPYFVKTNFEGFKEIVDTLGGVELDVEKRMHYPAEDIDLKPGLQRLDGYNALAYVRFRYDALGDISRTERQQKFLTVLAKETLQASNIIKAPILIPQIMKALETNLGVSDAIFLMRVASNLDSNNIVTATLPGSFYNYKGASFWKVDESKVKIVLNELFQGLKLATVSGPDINVPTDKPSSKKPKQELEPTPEPTPSPENTLPEDADQQQPDGNTDIPVVPQENNDGQTNTDPNNPELPPDANSGLQNPPNNSTDPVNPNTPGNQIPPTDGQGGTGDKTKDSSTTNTTPKVDIVTQG
jgi:LCP family protein required for cell wall assembly